MKMMTDAMLGPEMTVGTRMSGTGRATNLALLLRVRAAARLPRAAVTTCIISVAATVAQTE